MISTWRKQLGRWYYESILCDEIYHRKWYANMGLLLRKRDDDNEWQDAEFAATKHFSDALKEETAYYKHVKRYLQAELRTLRGYFCNPEDLLRVHAKKEVK